MILINRSCNPHFQMQYKFNGNQLYCNCHRYQWIVSRLHKVYLDGSIGNNTLVNTLRPDPTRVCSTSMSTIDLILVYDVQNIKPSGVIACGMSDHVVTYCTRKVCKQQVNSHNSVSTIPRNYSVKDYLL